MPNPVKTFKLAATMTAAATALVLLAGCSSPAETPDKTSAAQPSASVTPTPTPEPVPDLTGTWKQSNSHSETDYQQATITGTTISVDWVADAGQTTSIYWVGSFTPPTAAGSYEFTSNNDHSQTENALMASNDDTKVFSYDENGTLSYKVTALGTTTTVELKQQ